MTPKDYLASGDTYTRKYDEIITDIPRNCVDDTVLWDEELANYWWRMNDYLEDKMELYLIQKILVYTKTDCLCLVYLYSIGNKATGKNSSKL